MATPRTNGGLPVDIGRRCDFHTHTIISDGTLIASELARRADALDHMAIAITDHVDKTNLNFALQGLVDEARDINAYWDVMLLVGVELTHVPYQTIDELARRAKTLGANIVLVHGETVAEPVIKGTNAAAVQSRYVDILAHPGKLTHGDAQIAAETGKFAEITTKAGHDETNKHVATIAMETELDMLVNTDLHSPDDFITQRRALEVAVGAGMKHNLAMRTIKDNPLSILNDVDLHCRR